MYFCSISRIRIFYATQHEREEENLLQSIILTQITGRYRRSQAEYGRKRHQAQVNLQ